VSFAEVILTEQPTPILPDPNSNRLIINMGARQDGREAQKEKLCSLFSAKWV
jgi:hypothetical protein